MPAGIEQPDSRYRIGLDVDDIEVQPGIMIVQWWQVAIDAEGLLVARNAGIDILALTAGQQGRGDLAGFVHDFDQCAGAAIARIPEADTVHLARIARAPFAPGHVVQPSRQRGQPVDANRVSAGAAKGPAILAIDQRIGLVGQRYADFGSLGADSREIGKHRLAHAFRVLGRALAADTEQDSDHRQRTCGCAQSLETPHAALGRNIVHASRPPRYVWRRHTTNPIKPTSIGPPQILISFNMLSSRSISRR